MAHLDIDFISNTLSRAVSITLILPTKTAPTLEANYVASESKYYQNKQNKKYPLLILLHGLLNDNKNWTSYARAELYAEENNIAICTISGENSFYVNNEKDKFFDFIEYELKDFLYGNFPISPLVKDNFIAGLSMGGFGSLVHAFSCPERYGAVGSFSAPIIMHPINGVSFTRKLFNDRYLFNIIKKTLEEKKNLPYVYISIGENDNPSLVKDNIKIAKMIKASPNNGIDFKIEKGYAHEWRFWDKELEIFIKKLPRSDDYIKESPRGV